MVLRRTSIRGACGSSLRRTRSSSVGTENPTRRRFPNSCNNSRSIQDDVAACMNHNVFRIAFQQNFQAAPGQTVLAFDVLIRIGGRPDENSASPNLGARLSQEEGRVHLGLNPRPPRLGILADMGVFHDVAVATSHATATVRVERVLRDRGTVLGHQNRARPDFLYG